MVIRNASHGRRNFPAVGFRSAGEHFRGENAPGRPAPAATARNRSTRPGRWSVVHLACDLGSSTVRARSGTVRQRWAPAPGQHTAQRDRFPGSGTSSAILRPQAVRSTPRLDRTTPCTRWPVWVKTKRSGSEWTSRGRRNVAIKRFPPRGVGASAQFAAPTDRPVRTMRRCLAGFVREAPPGKLSVGARGPRSGPGTVCAQGTEAAGGPHSPAS